MEPAKLPPPLVLYTFIAFAFSAWLIIFVDFLNIPGRYIDAAIPVALLVFIGYCIVSPLFHNSFGSVITILLWTPAIAIASVVYLVPTLFGFHDPSPQRKLYSLIEAFLQCAAAFFLFRRPLMTWLISGGYADYRQDEAFRDGCIEDEEDDENAEELDTPIVPPSAGGRPSRT